MLRVCQYLALIVQYVERNLQLLAILPLQIYRCVQLNSVLFSSSWSSMLVVINKIQ